MPYVLYWLPNVTCNLLRHINIGTRFQAEIPLLQDKSLVEDSVHLADLVWKPWEDIETSKVTQARGEFVTLHEYYIKILIICRE